MRTSLLFRVAVVSSSLALISGCPSGGGGGGGGGGGFVPDPPIVTVRIPNPTVVGMTYGVEITVNNCDGVRKVELFDNATLIRTLTHTANPLFVELDANEIPYRNGIAANPLFKAKAFCNDGRVNTSAPQSGRFFPVEQVIRAGGGAQTVTDTFQATNTGAGTHFIGCSQDPATQQRVVVAVNTSGGVFARNTTIAVRCSDQAIFSEKSIHGTRWMLEPYDRTNPDKGSGLVELDDTLGSTPLEDLTTFPGKVLAMGVAPDGNVVAATLDHLTATTLELRKIRHRGGVMGPNDNLWTQPVFPAGQIISNIVIDSSHQVVVTSWQQPSGNPNVGNIIVDRFDYRTGARVASYTMRQIAFGLVEAAPIPTARLNASGSVVFFPVQVTAQNSQVIACATRTPNCSDQPNSLGEPAGLVWASEVLPAPVLVAQPYASDSRIAALSQTAAWFLSAYDGQIRNPNQAPIRPEGALRFLAYQEGKAKDFYLLSGAARTTEIIAVETAENGELIRFGLVNGSLSISIADDGQPWIRVDKDLVKPFRLVEYRLARTE